MAKYAVEISEGVEIELDVAPGAPTLERVAFQWDAHTESELRGLVERLGGLVRWRVIEEQGFVSRRAPLTRDGEEIGHAGLTIWLRGELDAREPTWPILRTLAGEQALLPAVSR